MAQINIYEYKLSEGSRSKIRGSYVVVGLVLSVQPRASPRKGTSLCFIEMKE